MNYAETMVQHFVTAYLELALDLPFTCTVHLLRFLGDQARIQIHEYVLNDSVLLVTASGAEEFTQLCRSKTSVGILPVIITLNRRLDYVRCAIEDAGIQRCVEILTVEQMLVTYVLKRSLFQSALRDAIIVELVDRYNRKIDEAKSDSSLKILVNTRLRPCFNERSPRWVTFSPPRPMLE